MLEQIKNYLRKKNFIGNLDTYLIQRFEKHTMKTRKYKEEIFIHNIYTIMEWILYLNKDARVDQILLISIKILNVT